MTNWPSWKLCQTYRTFRLIKSNSRKEIENPLATLDGFQRSRVETLERQKTEFDYSNPAFSREDGPTEERTATGVKRLSAPRWSINTEELGSKKESPLMHHADASLPGVCGVVFSTLLKWSKHMKLAAIVLAFVVWYELNMWIGFFYSPQSFRGKHVLIWLAYFPSFSLGYLVFMVRTFKNSSDCHFSAEN